MYRKPSKEKELTKRILTYSVMTILVGLLVTILTLIILGYRIDINNGQVERGALLQLDSEPSGATVLVDGNVINVKTSGKYTVTEGSHTFAFKKDGYETWQKTVDVRANTLTWLNYVRLIPVDRPTESVADFTKVVSSLVTPDNKKLLVQEDGTKPIYKLVDLKNDDVKISSIVLGPSLYTSPNSDTQHVFLADRWDMSGRYLLVKHFYSGQVEWLVIDTQDPTRSKNVTKQLSINIGKADFSGSSGNILYATVDGNIRKLDLSAATLSRVLVTNVSDFSVFDTNVIVYTGFNDVAKSKSVVGLYREGDDNPHVLRTVDNVSTVLRVATAKYFNKDYVAIAENKQVDILSGSYPASGSNDNASLSELTSFSLETDVNYLEFSPSGDYLLAQSLIDFAGYDIEYNKLGMRTIEPGDSATVSPFIKWLDLHHLWSSYNNQLTMYDFDGTNPVVINKMSSGKTALLGANKKYIYSIDSTDTGYILQRVKL